MALICILSSNPIVHGTGPFSVLYVRANSSEAMSVLNEIKFKHNLDLTQSELSIEILALLWCREFAALCKSHSFGRVVKNHLMRDFLDTIYLHESSFNAIAILFLSQDTTDLNVYEILWKILGFASANGLKYLNRSGVAVTPVDFPFQFWGSCDECSLPLRMTAIWNKPDMVRRLLNLGSRVPNDDNCKAKSQVHWQNDNHPILRLFNGCTFQVPESWIPGKSAKDADELIAYKDAIVCLNMLLVDIPYFSGTWNRVKMALKQFSSNLVEDHVPSLKHICRFHIRSTLKSNNNICKLNIWKELNLPIHLDSYLKIDLRMESEIVKEKLKK